jgi:hypothetical protein
VDQTQLIAGGEVKWENIKKAPVLGRSRAKVKKILLKHHRRVMVVTEVTVVTVAIVLKIEILCQYTVSPFIFFQKNSEGL